MKANWIHILLTGMTLAAAVPAQIHAQAEQVSAPMPPSTQVNDPLLAGTERFAVGASDVSEVNLDPSALGMVSGNGGEAALAKKMNFIVVRSYKYDKPGMYSMQEFDTIRRRLDDGGWVCSVHVRDKDGSTDICARKGADHESNETIIMTSGPKEVTFVHMKGKASLADLSRMGTPAPPNPPVLKQR
jgi:hypothetical protein